MWLKRSSTYNTPVPDTSKIDRARTIPLFRIESDERALAAD